MITSFDRGEAKDRAINNLLLGIIITNIVLLGIPFLLSKTGWSGAPAGKSWVILIAACFAYNVKLLASETATGEFEFYKFGYDNCATTLGGVITALAMQLPSREDLFPGLANNPLLPTFGNMIAAEARIYQLALAFTLTLLFTFIAARICGGIKKKEINERGLKALLCGVFGPLFLFLYALLLAARG